MQYVLEMELPELKRLVAFAKNGGGLSKIEGQENLILFRVKGFRITVFSANKDGVFWAAGTIVSSNFERGDEKIFTMNSDLLHRALGTQDTKLAMMTLEEDGESLLLKIASLELYLELKDGSNLRMLEEIVEKGKEKEGLVLTRDVLIEAMTYARSCTATEGLRPETWQVELRRKLFLSSDGRKIMIYSRSDLPEELSFRIPSSNLSPFIGALKAGGPGGNIQVVAEGAYYYFTSGTKDQLIAVRRNENQFPEVELQLGNEKDYQDHLTIDTNVFGAMTKGVSLGLPPDEVKITLEITGDNNSAELEVQAVNSLKRVSKERTMIGRTAKKPLSFPISYRHVLDTLQLFKGDSVVDIMVHDKKNYIVIMDKTELRVVRTIIPFRTKVAQEKEEEDRRQVEKQAEKQAENQVKAPEIGEVAQELS